MNKERCKLWYEKNREWKLKYQKEYNQRTNYASEKTENERKKRYIRRLTRLKYPLKGEKCKCGLNAVEHHHTTKPIEVDKFIFVCHNCHKIENAKM